MLLSIVIVVALLGGVQPLLARYLPLGRLPGDVTMLRKGRTLASALHHHRADVAAGLILADSALVVRATARSAPTHGHTEPIQTLLPRIEQLDDPYPGAGCLTPCPPVPTSRPSIRQRRRASSMVARSNTPARRASRRSMISRTAGDQSAHSTAAATPAATVPKWPEKAKPSSVRSRSVGPKRTGRRSTPAGPRARLATTPSAAKAIGQPGAHFDQRRRSGLHPPAIVTLALAPVAQAAQPGVTMAAITGGKKSCQ